MVEKLPLCACGCGKKVTKRNYYPYIMNKYISGHNGKKKRKNCGGGIFNYSS